VHTSCCRSQQVLELRWDPPDFDGGAPIAGYRLDMAQVGSVLEDGPDGASINGKVGQLCSAYRPQVSVHFRSTLSLNRQ